jgi:hypothetical protein
MLIPNVRDSMTIGLETPAKNKYRLTEMCPHDRISREAQCDRFEEIMIYDTASFY